MNVELTEAEAMAFRAFREHQANIEIMLASGVFDMRNGSVELHFDMQGKIGAIIGHPTMYRRDRLVVIPT